MIVRYDSDGTIVMINQTDHAHVSGLFAAHWGNETFEVPRPYELVVRGTTYHDIGWLRYETSPQLNPETGKTPTFAQVPKDKQMLDAFEWAGDWLSSIDPYAGLMFSKHRTGLWQSRYGVVTHPPTGRGGTLPPAIAEFIARSEAKQKQAAEQFDAKEFATNYNLLQVWDLMSLYICTTEVIKPDVIDPVPLGYSQAKGVPMNLTPLGRTRSRSRLIRSISRWSQPVWSCAACSSQSSTIRPNFGRSTSRPHRRSLHSGSYRARSRIRHGQRGSWA